MYICPMCYSKSVGKIGNKQYYCWDCCVEFIEQQNKLSVFQVTDDGSLAILEGENMAIAPKQTCLE